MGKPTFRYAQFIHKTGFYIVELRDNGDFFLAPNNMHLTRVRSSTTLVGDYENYSKGVLADSQTVMLNFRAACQNKEFLKETFTLAKSIGRMITFHRLYSQHVKKNENTTEQNTKNKLLY